MTATSYFWHELAFKIRMLTEGHEYRRINQVDSPVHSMLANEIFGPLIEELQEDIQMWRFHRTFKPANKFHPFRLKFYGLDGVDSKATEFVQAHPLYQQLKKEDLLHLEPGKDIICEKLNHETAIKDDNYPEWSEEIKEIWPYYIHGASRAWLKMIQVFRDKGKIDPGASLGEKIDYYERINNHIEREWVKWGRHAMLHTPS